MDSGLPEDSRKSDVDLVVDLIPSSYKTLIFGVYVKLNEFERHFEIMTTKYKYIALTWLLASFAGIGFLLSNKADDLPFSHMISVALVSFIGFIGVSLIGNVDMNVYHRFWAALFVEEVVMEEHYKFLLQSRKITLLIDESRERVLSQSLLYLVSNIILLMTLETCLIFEFSYLGLYYVFLMSIIAFLVLVFTWFLMHKNSQRIRDAFHSLIEKRLAEEKHRKS